MSDDWENEDYEPKAPSGPPATDRWVGEDEEDEVKDNWEDDDEDNQNEEDKPAGSGAYQRPKKKSLADRIAEKEKMKEQQAAAKKEEIKDLTPEEKLAEKIRLQKVQEEADLKIAKGLFGVEGSQGGIDGMYPQTEEEFDKFEDALKTKITFFQDSKLYPAFATKLINSISLALPGEDIKKIGIALNSLYHEKERIRKEQIKNQKKKKVKATIKMDRADDLGLADGTAAYYDDDDDDFI